MKKTNSILTLLLTLSLGAFSQTNDVATLSKYLTKNWLGDV